MERFKRIIRIAGFIFLMILALVGVGLGGVGPILPKNRERMIMKVKTEQVDKLREDNREREVFRM